MARWFYKCSDCLSPVAIDADAAKWAGRTLTRPAIENPTCGACGGRLTLMGQVTGPAAWTRRETLCKCDDRCVCASGPNCDCSCGGENHGAGVLGYVEQVAEVGTVRIVPVNGDECQTRAAEYRAARAAAAARIETLPGIEAYRARQWIDEGRYWAIRHAAADLAKAERLRTHKGRLAALARIAAPAAAAVAATQDQLF